MSWSASFGKPVLKAQANGLIDGLTTGPQIEAPAMDQLELAKHTFLRF